MAIVRPILPSAPTIKYPDISEIMTISSLEIVERPLSSTIEEIVYVAVGKQVKESKLTLIYALQNSGGKKICIIHVHEPANMIPFMGTKFPASSLKDQEVRAFREIERQIMHKVLDEYLLLCRHTGARAEKQYIESDSTEKGIVELISQHGIRKLVMGAAADKRYSRKMVDIKSKKAIYVRLQAPDFCHIQFICKGKLIHTREVNQNGACAEAAFPSVSPAQSPLIPLSQIPQAFPSNPFRSLSLSVATANGMKNADYLRANSVHDDYWGNIIHSSSPVIDVFQSPMGLSPLGDFEDRDQFMRRSPSELSVLSSVSCNGENDIVSYSSRLAMEESHQSSPPSVLDGCTDENLYEQLKQTITEAPSAKRETLVEALRLRRAEKDATDTVRRARVAESLYAVDLLQKYKIEHDELTRQRDNALKEAQMLNSHGMQGPSEFQQEVKQQYYTYLPNRR